MLGGKYHQKNAKNGIYKLLNFKFSGGACPQTALKAPSFTTASVIRNVWPQPWSISPGGYSEFQVTKTIEWGQKSKPKKIPRASNKTQKNPWHRTTRPGYAGTTTNLQIVLNTQKIPT